MSVKKVIEFCKSFNLPLYKLKVDDGKDGKEKTVTVQGLINAVKVLKELGLKFKTITVKPSFSTAYILSLVKVLIESDLVSKDNASVINYVDDILDICIKNKDCNLLKAGIEAIKK